MAIIKNLTTGFTTECSNADVIRICKADVEHYEVLEGVVEKTAPKKATKTTAKKK